MPEAVTAPAATTPAAPAAPAPAADAPVVRKGPPRASDYLAEAATADQGGRGGTGEVRQEPPKAAPKPEDAEVESRITKLAGERRQLDTERQAHTKSVETWKAEQAETIQHATSYRKVAALVKEGKVLEALKAQGWTQEQIDTKVYTDLAKDILAREPGEPLTRRDVEEMTQARLDAQREADKKAAEEAATAREETVRANYLAGVDAAFDPEKYPALAKNKATRKEVLDFVSEFYDAEATRGEVPTAEQVHQHFEELRRKDALEIAAKVGGGQSAPAAAPLPTGITQAMRASSTPDGRDYSKMSRAERWALDKAEAGIEPGA